MVSVLFLLSLDLMVCMFLDTVFPVVGKRVIKHFPEVSCVDNKKITGLFLFKGQADGQDGQAGQSYQDLLVSVACAEVVFYTSR